MKTPIDLNNKTILVTGSPGFIGANLVIRLLQTLTSGTVVSLDNMNDYYEVSLKEWRLEQINTVAATSPVKHVFVKGSIGDKALVDQLFADYHFDIVVNLAAQAALLGVSVAVILWLTVLRRETVVEDSLAYRPFHSLLSFWSSIRKQGIRGNFLGNIIIFMPIGLLYPIVFGTAGNERKKYRTVLFGFGLSLLVELSQLVFSKGYFDLDDILLNTVGTAIGLILYMTIYQRIRVKHN